MKDIFIEECSEITEEEYKKLITHCFPTMEDKKWIWLKTARYFYNVFKDYID